MKKIFYIVICGMMTLAADAQNLQLPSIQLSANQKLIEDAICDGLFVVQQNYQIKDTSTTPPTFYRWGNDPHLGTVYVVGIKVNGGFYSESKILFPWNGHTNYEQYRNIAHYVPVISATNLRPSDSTHFITMPFDPTACKLQADSLTVFVKSDLFVGKGFRENYSPGKKEGWLAWIIADKQFYVVDTLPYSFLIYRTELVYEQAKRRYEIKNPMTNKEILGGLYIVPELSDIGQITFNLSGVLINIDNKWNVVRLDQNTSASPLQPVQQTSGGLTPSGLTPVRPNTVEKQDSLSVRPAKQTDKGEIMK
jgi:hypothetical protein